MAMVWYPVIDYLSCTECGACVAKCSHGVYAKSSTPVVTNPEACIDHCHGCGNLCPVGAITYVGEDTGFTAPDGIQESRKTCCSCECEIYSEKKIVVDYLYLDLQTCDRCIGTDVVLDEVMMTLTPSLMLAGFDIKYNKIEMKTAKIAERFAFYSSPTIRVNGQDICGPVKENSCGCCSEISGTDVNCRLFEYNGKCYEVPPKEMIAGAILKTIFGTTVNCSSSDYKLPDNLKAFYEGRSSKSICSCGNNCC